MEAHLGSVIENEAKEENTHEKALKGIQQLRAKWTNENVGICGRVIIASTLFKEKLSHRESVSRLSTKIRGKINNTIKSFVRGEAKKKARVA